MSALSRSARAFHFNGLTLRASSSDEGHLIWLDEFLTPWFEPAPQADADCDVELIEDRREYARRRANGPREDGGLVHCFWLDRGAVLLPLWCSAAKERVVFDERMRVFYVLGSDPTSVKILTAPGNSNARFALMRVIRELALIRTRASGQLLIHGAAVEVDGNAFLIAGAKGAGKTSLLIALLLEHAARFVSNDRVVVRHEAGGPMLRGMPTIVSVRSQTLEAHPVLRSRLERRGYHHRLTVAETERANSQPQWTARGSIDLSPAQLCALVGVHPSPQGRLRAVLFSDTGAIEGRAALARLSVPDAAARLTAVCLAADADRMLSEGFFNRVPAPPVRGSAGEDYALETTARLPSFELQPDRSGFEGRRAVAELVRVVASEDVVLNAG